MKKLINIIFIIIIISVGWNFYSQYNFGDYVKAEYNRGLTKFSRDSKVTYDGKTKSSKLENTDYTDAMFFKKINVSSHLILKIHPPLKRGLSFFYEKVRERVHTHANRAGEGKRDRGGGGERETEKERETERER